MLPGATDKLFQGLFDIPGVFCAFSLRAVVLNLLNTATL